MKKAKGEYSIQTVANALRVLEEFQGDVEIGVAELSRRLGLHKNNVFRLLATLEEAGFIEQDLETERYRLGLGALELGRAFLRGRPLIERAMPHLRELSDRFDESTHLGVLHDFQVVHVAGHAPERLLVTPSRVGTRLPVHCTALGKVLIGCCPEGQREAYDRTVAAEGSLAPRTKRTITDPDKFFEHIRTVAGQGFATDLDECEAGLVCAAAPVYDSTGRVAAALSLSAPASRLGEEQLIREVLPQVMASAERLSRELGYHAPAA
ncbi:MAG: IclR family transcriptional regulator [Myxococcota bacterium]